MRLAGAFVMLLAVLVGCTDVPPVDPRADVPAPTTATRTPPEPSASTRTPTPSPSARPTSSVVTMSIPSIGVRGLRVVSYQGTADDRPGTTIQNRGVAASPRGPGGGVGAGEIGNFIITGHRVSHGRPLERVPGLANGAHILIATGGTVYDYVVSQTMTISFRKPAEKAQQNAAVPGRPGVQPTQAMLTISTCATPEDNAAGNYWRDALGNPEHRINKIATLTATRPA
ncbi:sortase domain-bontaining protein [Kribbella sp. NPDC058245]|uniref:sortase domain-containing protein n=1 Tax=Kribbella sp. NPDC058245 TaxID=3346399 RepID=UPI0036E08A45